MRQPGRTVLALGVALACGCAAGPSVRTAGEKAPSGPTSALEYEKRTFKLSKTPDPAIEMGLQEALDAAYEHAVAAHSGDKPMEIGFTYSVAPTGAIYPFSEVEVSCLMQQKHRSKGKRLCRYFFEDLEKRLKALAAAPL
jgi:hypothetical protein